MSDDHHLSLIVLKGSLGVGTIKFMVHVGTLPLKVLIDGGSLYNFLQSKVVKLFKLLIEKAPVFIMMVGIDNYMKSERSIQHLTLHA